MTRKRCPNGSRLNKKTKRCNKIKKPIVKKIPTPPKKHKQPSQKKITQKKKRCPNGSRLNKKTGLCDAISVTNTPPDVPINSNVIDVPPVENIEELGKVVYNTVKAIQEKKTEILKTVNTPSFTPDANKQLLSLNMKTPNEVMAYKCIDKEKRENFYDGLSIKDMKDILEHDQYFESRYLGRISKSLNLNKNPDVLKKLAKIAENPPDKQSVMIKIGNTGTDKDYKCLNWNDEKVKSLLLINLNSKKNIDFSKIIGPQQYLSNCWFNTALMCLFISDKGRKFTRGMRNDMINGNISTHITNFV